jgi:hypothetical protein
MKFFILTDNPPYTEINCKYSITASRRIHVKAAIEK